MDARHIPSLNPKITNESLSAATENNERDKRGSYPGSRRGPLRGAPSVTWFSLSNFGMPKKINTVEGASPVVYIQGYNMFTCSNIYLSASNANMFEQKPKEYSFFEQTYSNRLSSENPPISGVPLSGWTTINNNNIYFNIPKITGTGSLDIVLQGPAGYSLMSEGTYSETEQEFKYIEVVCSIDFIHAEFNNIIDVFGKIDCITDIPGNMDCITNIAGNINCDCIFSLQTDFECITTIAGDIDCSCIHTMRSDFEYISTVSGTINCE